MAAWSAACASSSAGEPDPAVEDQQRAQDAANTALEARQNAFQQVLLTLDKALDKYVQEITDTGLERADRVASGLESFLRTTVAKHFDALVRAADDSSNPAAQAIAAGALGMSGSHEALDPLLNAVRSAEPEVCSNAVFGLGMLRDERTPPQPIADVLENPALPINTRRGAAWSLVEVQSAIHQPERIAPVWLRLISAPEGEVDSLILMQALRGLGHLRQPQYAVQVEPFVKHPTPGVRYAAAMSLGFLGNRDSHAALIACLDSAETNPNVRLAARKALQELAGGVDRGYDVREWRRVFETKNG